jgi:non-homologous end joining protein Ku
MLFNVISKSTINGNSISNTIVKAYEKNEEMYRVSEKQEVADVPVGFKKTIDTIYST